MPAFAAFVQDEDAQSPTSELLLAALATDPPLEALAVGLGAWEAAWDGGKDPDAALADLLQRQSADGARLLQRLAQFTPRMDEFVAIATLLQEAQLQIAQAAHRAHARVTSVRKDTLGRLDALAIVSHELRTPLTGIMGYAELLEDAFSTGLTGTEAQFVGKIQESGERLLRLVEDLLDVAKLESGTFHVVPQDADLAALVQEIAALMQPQAEALGVALTCEIEPEIGTWGCRLDPRRIWQVVGNLVQNALKFTPAGGQVRLRAQRRADWWRVEVTDTGAGFPPEQATHLFEKFYQVDRRLSREHSGAGLGLSICKALVEAHGGRIGAASVQGRGSTFWFELPR